MSLSDTQRESMIGISMAAAWVSIIGSSSILAVLFRSQSRLSTTYRRLMCGISIADLISSFVWIVGDLPAPHGTPFSMFAYGNTATCAVQGFMQFTGQVGSALYMCSLCLYYVLTITGQSSMNSDQNINRKLEFCLHGVPILFVTATGLFMLVEGSFNYSGQVCWIAPKPLNCILNPNVECERGAHSYDHRWWFSGYPLFACFGLILLCMLFLIWKVKEQWSSIDRFRRGSVVERYQTSIPANEERRRNFTSPTSQATSQQQQQRGSHQPDEVSETVIQALLYIAGFLATYTLAIASTIIRMRGNGKPIFILYLFANFLLPLQGFFNFFIFIRPRLVMLRRSHPDMPFLRLVWTAVSTRTEVSRLNRRRRGSARLAVNNRPRRGYTARELYLQRRAKEQEQALPGVNDPGEEGGRDQQQGNNKNDDDDDDDEEEEEEEENLVFMGGGGGEDVDGIDVLVSEEEYHHDDDVDAFKKDDEEEGVERTSGSTKPSEVSHTSGEEEGMGHIE